MSTQSKTTAISVHLHFGRVVLSGADGYLEPIQAKALAAELKRFTAEVEAGNHPATRLVYPNGTRVTESTGGIAYVFV
jgi:hypothetical protein